MWFDLPRYWYRQRLHLVTICLLPFSYLFFLVSCLRRFLYRYRIIKTHQFNVPVIVVGNIVAGGTGKTPLVIWLAHILREHGYKPGIVSRGAGGKRQRKPHLVESGDSAVAIGDEALLLSRGTGCPVMLCVDRVAAVQALLASTDCNVIISDDGLQHYRMGRQIEIVVVDGERRFGNGCYLPAGPLREPVSRLQQADFIVVNGGNENDRFIMQLEPVELVSVAKPDSRVWLDAFKDQSVHAVAGIGHPARFFDTLKKAGYQMSAHAFPDHHVYQKQDIDFKDNRLIIMTEKDAVKCTSFADDRYWYVSVRVKMNSDMLVQEMLSNIQEGR